MLQCDASRGKLQGDVTRAPGPTALAAKAVFDVLRPLMAVFRFWVMRPDMHVRECCMRSYKKKHLFIATRCPGGGASRPQGSHGPQDPQGPPGLQGLPGLLGRRSGVSPFYLLVKKRQAIARPNGHSTKAGGSTCLSLFSRYI